MNRTSSSLFLLRALLLSCASGFACAQNLGGFEFGFAPNILDTCKSKYGATAADKLREESVKVGVCVKEKIVIFSQDLARIHTTALEETAVFNSIPSILCSSNNSNLLPRIKNCIQPLLVALKGCTDNVVDAFIDSQEKTMSNAINHICQDNGNKLLKFIKEGNVQCLKGMNFEECSDKIANGTNKIWDNMLIDPVKACTMQQDLGQCLVSKMDQLCSTATSPSKIYFKESVDILTNKGYKCASLKNGGSKLWNNNANVLSTCLLIFVYGYRYFL